MRPGKGIRNASKSKNAKRELREFPRGSTFRATLRKMRQGSNTKPNVWRVAEIFYARHFKRSKQQDATHRIAVCEGITIVGGVCFESSSSYLPYYCSLKLHFVEQIGHESHKQATYISPFEL